MTNPPRYGVAPAASGGGRALNFIGAVSGIVTIVAALVSLMWYVVSVEGRISRLEAQMQTIATAPSVMFDPTPGSSKPSDAKATNEVKGEPNLAALNQNPLQNACMNLVDKATKYSGAAYEASFRQTMEVMHTIGCDGFVAAQKTATDLAHSP